MPITTEQLLADQAFWFADFPTESLTISEGGTYNVIVVRAEDRNNWELGGLKDEPRVSVIFNRNSAPLPADIPPGTQVSLRSKSWRVVSVRHDFGQSPMMVELESANLHTTGAESSFVTADQTEPTADIQ